MSAVLAEPFPIPGRPGDTRNKAVLILDDCAFDREMLCRMIEKAKLPFDAVEVDTLEAMGAALDERAFDLVLIDYYLAGTTGFEALELLAHRGGTPPVTIMVTGDEQTDIAVKAMKLGCADYVPKDALSEDRLRTVFAEALDGRADWTREQENRLQAVEALTGNIVSRFSDSVCPEMAGIVRELRLVKSDLAATRDVPPHQEKAVKERSMELWGKLRDPETYRRNQH